MKWFDIHGSIEADVDEDTLNTEFVTWLESKGWSFFGFMGPSENGLCEDCQRKFDEQNGELRVLDMCEECRLKVLESIQEPEDNKEVN